LYGAPISGSISFPARDGWDLGCNKPAAIDLLNV